MKFLSRKKKSKKEDITLRRNNLQPREKIIMKDIEEKYLTTIRKSIELNPMLKEIKTTIENKESDYIITYLKENSILYTEKIRYSSILIKKILNGIKNLEIQTNNLKEEFQKIKSDYTIIINSIEYTYDEKLKILEKLKEQKIELAKNLADEIEETKVYLNNFNERIKNSNYQDMEVIGKQLSVDKSSLFPELEEFDDIFNRAKEKEKRKEKKEKKKQLKKQIANSSTTTENNIK